MPIFRRVNDFIFFYNSKMQRNNKLKNSYFRLHKDAQENVALSVALQVVQSPFLLIAKFFNVLNVGKFYYVA